MPIPVKVFMVIWNTNNFGMTTYCQFGVFGSKEGAMKWMEQNKVAQQMINPDVISFKIQGEIK